MESLYAHSIKKDFVKYARQSKQDKKRMALNYFFLLQPQHCVLPALTASRIPQALYEGSGTLAAASLEFAGSSGFNASKSL